MVAGVIAFAITLFLDPRYRVLPLEGLGFSALSALFFSLYSLFSGKAYASDGGDLSLSYPLVGTAPIYISFLAYCFLVERISLQAMIERR